MFNAAQMKTNGTFVMVRILSRNEHFWITEQGENAIVCHSKSDEPSVQKPKHFLYWEKKGG